MHVDTLSAQDTFSEGVRESGSENQTPRHCDSSFEDEDNSSNLPINSLHYYRSRLKPDAPQGAPQLSDFRPYVVEKVVEKIKEVPGPERVVEKVVVQKEIEYRDPEYLINEMILLKQQLAGECMLSFVLEKECVPLACLCFTRRQGCNMCRLRVHHALARRWQSSMRIHDTGVRVCMITAAQEKEKVARDTIEAMHRGVKKAAHLQNGSVRKQRACCTL